MFYCSFLRRCQIGHFLAISSRIWFISSRKIFRINKSNWPILKSNVATNFCTFIYDLANLLGQLSRFTNFEMATLDRIRVSHVLRLGETTCATIHPTDPPLQPLHPTNLPLHINLPHFPATLPHTHLHLSLLVLFLSLPPSHHHQSFLPLTTHPHHLPLHIHPLLNRPTLRMGGWTARLAGRPLPQSGLERRPAACEAGTLRSQHGGCCNNNN